MPTTQKYWSDPHGNIRRMAGEQDIIATVTDACSDVELQAALCGLDAIEEEEAAIGKE